jgi:hypothetical protein
MRQQPPQLAAKSKISSSQSIQTYSNGFNNPENYSPVLENLEVLHLGYVQKNSLEFVNTVSFHQRVLKRQGPLYTEMINQYIYMNTFFLIFCSDGCLCYWQNKTLCFIYFSVTTIWQWYEAYDFVTCFFAFFTVTMGSENYPVYSLIAFHHWRLSSYKVSLRKYLLEQYIQFNSIYFPKYMTEVPENLFVGILTVTKYKN